MNEHQIKPSKLVTSTLWILTACALQHPANAQDASKTEAHKNVSQPEAPAGLLPVPDYTGDFWTRDYLTGDWGGVRSDLANKGVQLGVEWNQYIQGVVDGGRDDSTEYGGTADYTMNLDLMRMGVLQGALIKFRAESRYGNSVNGASGAILPVNTDAFFPLASQLDDDIAFTITDLNYTQFLSEHIGVFLGKLDTLDGDLNEFASGRGTDQFMNANFIFSSALALRFPYSTLGAGLVWMPVPAGPNGGITVTGTILNTADSSTTTGFEDFDDGQTAILEADFQYQLANRPGGMNIGGLYSFNQEFAQLSSRLVFQPGEGLSIPSKDSSWAIYWSAWQYLFTEEPGNLPINIQNGEQDLQGVGLFARVGFVDQDTNPIEWTVSGGVSGRGIISTRDNDTFGVGYYYASVQRTRLFSVLGVEDSVQGLECYYNIAITPACRVTLDLQVVNSVSSSVDTATILGMRAQLAF